MIAKLMIAPKTTKLTFAVLNDLPHANAYKYACYKLPTYWGTVC